MRKVLSFVLVLALVMSSFSMAFAADTTSAGLSDIRGNVNEDAIQVCYDLEIVTGNPDGTFLPDKTVTRAEFAAMLTRALDIPDSALTGYTQTNFKDTAGYSWAVTYLAFCQSKGILLGDGAGNVMPGRTISVNEAVTMALRAVGYTANSSLLVGSWPANYVSIAQNNDLYDDVSKATVVTKANAAQVIYNLLTVQKVAVDSDGSTDFLWIDGDEDEGAQNILNTNLGCDEFDEQILGSTGFSYDEATINISNKLGAFGDVYMDDDDLIAFAVDDDSIALTGSLSDDLDEFEVGDISYDIDNSDNEFTSEGAYFYNGDYSPDDDCDFSINTEDGKITVEDIASFAAIYADDGDTVTINCELSGKTISDIYSVVAWKADEKDLAESDVQTDIADLELLGCDFVDDDNGDLDMNSFDLVGIESLNKIAEDDVVYVYTDDNDDIRRVAVGTEILEGTAEEVEMDDDDINASTVTIGGKDYDVSDLATSDAQDIDTDSEGTFYLDYLGEIYDFDGTSGEADTFAIVKAFDLNDDDDFDNAKLKLYKSDDSTSTYYFAEDDPADEDMEWTLSSDLTSVASINAGVAKITPGALIGYSLDSSGDIDTIDVTSKEFASNAVNFQSSKVLKAGGHSYSIDNQCVVFTYKDIITNVDDYDVVSLNDVETGDLTSPASIILNDDGDVVAIFTDEENTNDNDYIFAVINGKTTAKDSSGDTVSKFKGFIDGTAFTYFADDEYSAKAGTFDVYRIDLDSDNVITEITSMDVVGEYADEDESGWINSSSEKVTDLDDDNTVITTASGKYTVADDAVVYEYDTEDEEFTVSKLSSIDDDGNFYVRLYDTKGSDADGIATLVIFWEN